MTDNNEESEITLDKWTELMETCIDDIKNAREDGYVTPELQEILLNRMEMETELTQFFLSCITELAEAVSEIDESISELHEHDQKIKPTKIVELERKLSLVSDEVDLLMDYKVREAKELNKLK